MENTLSFLAIYHWNFATVEGEFQMKLDFAAAMVAAGIALSSCATPYGTVGFMGGVESTPLSSNTEMINARGNGFTDPSRVQKFVLLKSAQDCLSSGFSKFVIVSVQDTSRTGTMVFPGQTYSNSTVTGFGNMATVNTTSYSTPASVVPFMKPGANVVVKFLKSDDPAAANAYDAQLIVNNLGPALQ